MAGNKRKKFGSELCENPLLLFSTDDCSITRPAAGYRNGTEINNRGSNGNYWSGTLNESNSNNAYNLNFNSSDHYVNNNYRENGHTVRPVSELATSNSTHSLYKITPQQLLTDLYIAYKDARKHKRRKKYQLNFELNLEENLIALRDEIYERKYVPKASTCFIVNSPIKREVFAADFRDRVVHHLFYNYTYSLFERVFINDSYSCRKRKGTHYGFKRLQHHIRRVSSHYSRHCYVLKVDIKGYFMHINRRALLDICIATLNKMAMRESVLVGKKWCEIIDYDLLYYLLEVIVLNNPLENCIKRGKAEDWVGLPNSKSLFYSAKGCGLPIGNLTSQLFSNVYMNSFDQYVKRTLKMRAYGRYVDDIYIVSGSKNELREIVAVLDDFLKSKLQLNLNPQKTNICNVKNGVVFLGGYAKPFRNYISNRSFKRMKVNIKRLSSCDSPNLIVASVNSFAGVLSHYSSYNLRCALFNGLGYLNDIGYFCNYYMKFKVVKS